MSLSKHGNCDPTAENVEQEDKVKVEEALVNLDCVKRELDEEELEFEHKQYKFALTLENVFGESSTLQRSNRDGLIGFLDGDVIMETGSIKLEDVKEENKDLIRKTIEQSDCNKCGGNYQGYCLNCSSLSHILNNITPNLNHEPVLNTTPLNMFEIREVLSGCAVFALKTLPKGIILGPFEGIAPIESTIGLQWKIKNKKLVNDQSGNWMKYIESVAKHSSRNLEVVQIDGMLYFETSREIQEGEELLVCYPEVKEEMLESDREEVFYLVPVKKVEYPKVFACTFCCLGFRLESCLVEHKSKCHQGDYGDSIKDFEIIQCRCCKMWLEKEEYMESHMLHCLENYNRSRRSRNLPDFAPTITADEEQVHENKEITPSIDVNASHSTFPTETIDSMNCVFRTDFKVQKEEYFHDKNMETTHSNTNNLKSRLGAHTKHFQCDICKRRFGRKDNLQVHIKDKHLNTNKKEYKCSQCSFKTNYRSSLKDHLSTHTGIKNFQCDICEQRFAYKSSLNVHMKTIHSNTNEKEYKCSECSFQTNWKGSLKDHLSTHTGIKNFQCDICEQRFGQKSNLKVHIKDKHSNTNEKEYKCSECSYQTIYKTSLERHLSTHSDIKHFQCDICKQKFAYKSSLNVHMKTKHSNTNEKEYKCSECSYQTNRKDNFKVHLDTHTGIKNFECDICKQRFAQKSLLKVHVKNKHLNTNEKEYKCSQCSYQTYRKFDFKRHLSIHSNTNEKEYKCSECCFQTNWKGSLKDHLSTHTGIKNFQCDICEQRFGQKSHLKVHIKNVHSNTTEKEYKCSECSYQTNRKDNFKVHLDTHTGIKNFECDICKQRFAQKCLLKVHVKNKHSNANEKEYKCSQCSYQTYRKFDFKRHLGIHSKTNEKEYKCSECSFQTNHKHSLNRHLGAHIKQL